MNVTRLLFLARYRVPHALFSMQWDRYLLGVDRTVVVSPVPQQELWAAFDRYDIDVSRLEYLADQEFVPRYPEIDHWVFEDDYRGPWLRQQAVKLAALDYLHYDVALMWDPDTFMTQPYECVDQHDGLCLMALFDTTHGSYNGQTERILGFPRQTDHCFVTEFMPVKKSHQLALRQHLEDLHSRPWLDAIIDHAPQMPTVPPWGTGNVIRWFSEYELLGNWAMHRESVSFYQQKRFEYACLDQLSQFDPSRYNAVCDAIPDLSQSMRFDWETMTVPGFHQYRSMLRDV